MAAVSPRLSVIVRVYNQAEPLAATLDGLIEQTFRDWEAIVVSDGSTDTSLSLARRYAAADARIRAISQRNSGPSVARNRGVADIASSSEYVLFLDAGEVLLPSALVRLLAAVEGAPEAAGAYGMYESQSVDSGRATRRGVKNGQVVRWPDTEPATFAVVAVAGSGPVTPGQVLIRREALVAAGRWDPVLERAAEWDLVAAHDPTGTPGVPAGTRRVRGGRAVASGRRRSIDVFDVRPVQVGARLAPHGRAARGPGGWHTRVRPDDQFRRPERRGSVSD